MLDEKLRKKYKLMSLENIEKGDKKE